MPTGSLSYDAPLAAYQNEAETLLASLRANDVDARLRFKWEHPSLRGKPLADVDPSAFEIVDAQVVVAHDYGFNDWASLVEFTTAVHEAGDVSRFEAAVEAVVNGDADLLRAMLDQRPNLVRERSTRRHRATLLHYLAANGVEGGRQRTPANAVEVARILLDRGAEVDALADMYEAKCTTMSLLVSSVWPHKAGLQIPLAETLLDDGAALVGPGSNWQSAVMAALTFGYLKTAEALAARGASIDDLVVAAGLGRVADAERLLPQAPPEARHAALALAAQHGQVPILRLLLDSGEDPNRFNPEGHHSHSTPLHQAVCANHLEAARFLVEHGARLDVEDAIFHGTPLGWAIHGGQTEIAEYLRQAASHAGQARAQPD